MCSFAVTFAPIVPVDGRTAFSIPEARPLRSTGAFKCALHGGIMPSIRAVFLQKAYSAELSYRCSSRSTLKTASGQRACGRLDNFFKERRPRHMAFKLEAPSWKSVWNPAGSQEVF